MTRPFGARSVLWLFLASTSACEDEPKEATQTTLHDAAVDKHNDAGSQPKGDASTSGEHDSDESGSGANAALDAGQITLVGESLTPDAAVEAGLDAAAVLADADMNGSMSLTSTSESESSSDATSAEQTGPIETSSDVSSSDWSTAAQTSSGESASETSAACGGASEMCCEESTCNEGLTCLGTGCSCAQEVTHGLVLRNDGRLLWHTGSTQTPIVNSETFESLIDVVSASTSNRHGCAVTEDGTARCFAAYAGANTTIGALANGTIEAEELGQWLAAPVLAAADTPLQDVVQVSSYAFGEGPSYPAGTCALQDNGQVWCWGAFTLMQDIPYDGFAHVITANEEADPVEDATYISVGASHACYLNAAGDVYCWGANDYGSVGVGATGEVAFPSRAGALTSVSKLQASDNFTCALVGEGDDEGQVFCWGVNTAGQLGLGDPEANSDCTGLACKQLPTRVRVSQEEYLSDVIDIAVGKRAACAITSDEHVYCWGTVQGPYAISLSETERTAGQEVLTIDGNVAMGPNGALWDFANYSNDSWLRLVLKDGRFVGTRTSASVATINCGTLD